jgi:t-SNARE complex subunit (syntaxin)
MTSIADQTLKLVSKHHDAIKDLSDIVTMQTKLLDEMTMLVRSQAVVIKDISDDVSDLMDRR